MPKVPAPLPNGSPLGGLQAEMRNGLDFGLVNKVFNERSSTLRMLPGHDHVQAFIELVIDLKASAAPMRIRIGPGQDDAHTTGLATDSRLVMLKISRITSAFAPTPIYCPT